MRASILCLTLLPLLASAEIYRWTDAQGRTHFEQRPVAGAERVEVKPQVIERDPATREREARSQRFAQARREEQLLAEGERDAQRSRREQECRDLRGQLNRLNRGRVFFRQDEKGERQYYSDTEIDAARRTLAARISEGCS